ncbi:hypothetical protein [Pseudoxanthomonas sp. PXM02]|uniref:hypothetical protein n=1 Tax=Pseudoxanthomonas sp. PXM02 TaxID=2769294 RepID=UPI00177AD2EF|nr:hypothetical protein [Pseudoxanthomonas sp. PXM02]MBD9480488.1 hypothetical protein [Pseudoxanthomonas sp. PXM02]
MAALSTAMAGPTLVARICAFIALLGLIAAMPANADEARAPDAGTRQVVELHREGIASVVQAIDAALARNEAVPARLQRIRADIVPALSWGWLAADGSLFALYPGKRDGVWGFVIETGHPLLDVPSATLSSTDLDGINAIRIRPDRFTPRWAGVFMVHELSHAFDARNEVAGAAACKREFDAYVVERQYYDLANDNRLSRALDGMIATLGLRRPEDVPALFAADRDRLADALAELERTLAEPPEASDAEREMRDGFYYVSLVDRLGMLAGMQESERCEAMLEAMQPASKY